MLRGYLDDSGTGGDTQVVCVSGFVATNSVWLEFEKQWESFLVEFELKRFHSTGFWSRKERPFSLWDNDKHARAIERVSGILRSSQLFGIGTGVTVKAFSEWRDSLDYYVDPDPYFFCLSRSLRLLIRGIRQSYNDDGVAVYIDQDQGRERLGLQLAKWHETRLRSRGQQYDLEPDRPVSTHYVSSFQNRPLQAADILSHAFYQQSLAFIENAQWTVPPFMQALHEGSIPVGTYLMYDREMLEIEERVRLANE